MWLRQVLKYSEILTQLESAKQDTSKVARELEASQAKTQAAELSTEAVTAQKARAEETLNQHLVEHGKLNEVKCIACTACTVCTAGTQAAFAGKIVSCVQDMNFHHSGCTKHQTLSTPFACHYSWLVSPVVCHSSCKLLNCNLQHFISNHSWSLLEPVL